MKIQWKYTEKASLHQAGSVKYFQIGITTYLTETAAAGSLILSYLYRISLYYFTKRTRRGGYFYRISTVFRTSYFVFLPNFCIPPKQPHAYHKLMRLVGEQIAL